MSTLIAYATKHGCTEKCAKKVANKLPDAVELKNLKNKMDVNRLRTFAKITRIF